jgi:hypothetical protein
MREFSIYHRGAEYNQTVARGWESKSVEEQQSQAADAAPKSRPRMNSEQAAREREAQGLRLSRQRVLQQLAAEPAPRHQGALRSALADLDQKLGALGEKSTSHPDV